MKPLLWPRKQLLLLSLVLPVVATSSTAEQNGNKRPMKCSNSILMSASHNIQIHWKMQSFGQFSTSKTTMT